MPHANRRRFFATVRMAVCLWAIPCVVAAPAASPTKSGRPRMLMLDGVAVGSDIVAVGERGSIYYSTDQAATWTRAVSPTRATLTGVSFAPTSPPRPARLGWAVGHDAIILSTSDAGRTWSRQYQGENLQESFLDVLAIDDRRIIAVGDNGLYCSTQDGGQTWTRRKVRTEDAHLNRISTGPSGHLYIAGEAGTLLRSTDHGTQWTPLPAPYDGSFYGVMVLDRRTLLAYGLEGRIFRSVDDGATWQPVASPVGVLLAAGLQLKSNHLLLAGHARTLLVSRDYGRTFVTSERALATGIAELIELADGKFLALGEAGATTLPLP